MATSEYKFGIGTLAQGLRPCVIVDDHALPIGDIVARYPGATKPAPQSMREFMPMWDHWHDWLRGLKLVPDAGQGWQSIKSAKFAAPVQEPWNIFSTYHNFDRPNRVTGAVDPPKSERVLPDIFYGSRSSLAGYGDVVYREHGGGTFDFEVEVTAVIGREAFRVKAEQADKYVAGYAISNDLTMHKAWWGPLRQRTPIADIIRMKNFPGYTPMSRAIVPRDLVGDPADLKVRAWVNGRLRQDTRTNKMLWSVGELVEYLSHVAPLMPGDLILMGSPEELPIGDYRGIQPGENVVCEVEKLGTLENIIQEQTQLQPYEGEVS